MGRAIYFPPGSPVVEMGKYASWPSASRKTVPSLEKNQTLPSVGCCLLPEPLQHPALGCSYQERHCPPWMGLLLSTAVARGVHPQNISVKRSLFFLLLRQLFPVSLCLCVYPKRCKISGYLIGTLCFSTRAFCCMH